MLHIEQVTDSYITDADKLVCCCIFRCDACLVSLTRRVTFAVGAQIWCIRCGRPPQFTDDLLTQYLSNKVETLALIESDEVMLLNVTLGVLLKSGDYTKASDALKTALRVALIRHIKGEGDKQ